MPAVPYRPAAPDSQAVRLSFEGEGSSVSNGQVTIVGNAEGKSIDRWTSYDVSSDFLTPADHFNFTIGAGQEGLDAETLDLLRMGAHVRLHVENLVLADGYIDAIEISAARNGGWSYQIRGRDRLGQALDGVADPTFQLKQGGSLAELLKRLFAPLGWTEEEHFEIDNTANRNARTGIRGVPTSKKKGKPLKSFVLHQTKPYNHESIYHFASRIAQRHGLWIWASADGERLIVGKPDFAQDPIFSLRRALDGTGNVLSGSVSYDMTNQPSVIVADSFSGGGEFGKGRCRAHMLNPYFGVDEDGFALPEASAFLSSITAGTQLTFTVQPFKKKPAKVPFRPMFLHDEESKTQEQLENYVRREMSLLVRQALTARYTVEGHGQFVGDRFVAWAPDTVVDVYDEPGELTERMWVLGVHFSKARGGGTTTMLDLVRLNSLQL